MPPRTRKSSDADEAAATADAGEEPKDEQTSASAPSYAGLPIVRRTVNVGIAGTLELPDELRAAVPRSRIKLTIEADLGAVKHKFTERGTVEESTILVVDAESVVVVSVTAPEPQPEQATIDDALAPDLEDRLGEVAGADQYPDE